VQTKDKVVKPPVVQKERIDSISRIILYFLKINLMVPYFEMADESPSILRNHND
jgi:hypothetical protein